MINEAEYRRYWAERNAVEIKAKKLIETVKECQKEFKWPTSMDDRKLCLYAKVKGLLSAEEYDIIRKYFSY